MMKKLTVTLVLSVMAAMGFAQQSPVTWNSVAEKAGAGQYKVTITATIPAPWHIYSQNTPDGGPVPTSFAFTKNPLVTVVGKTAEKGKLTTIHDKNFGVDVKYYSDKVVFTQLVKVKGNIKTNLSGTVNYEVCNDHECLPPADEPFSVKLQ